MRHSPIGHKNRGPSFQRFQRMIVIHAAVGQERPFAQFRGVVDRGAASRRRDRGPVRLRTCRKLILRFSTAKVLAEIRRSAATAVAIGRSGKLVEPMREPASVSPHLKSEHRATQEIQSRRK